MMRSCRVFARTFAVLYLFAGAFFLYAQEDLAAPGEEGFDIDSLFDEGGADGIFGTEDAGDAPNGAADGSGGASNDAGENSGGVLALLQSRGFSFNAGFSFSGGLFPGWSEAPWYWDTHKPERTLSPGIVMSASLGLGVQVTDSFFVRSDFSFSFPTFAFLVDNLYFDYNILGKVFIRGGKFSYNWGISRDFPFANLLSITPSAEQLGVGKFYAEDGGRAPFYTAAERYNTYMARVSVPIGIGGLELVVLTHDDLFISGNRQKELFSFGGKYNLAFRWADINLGVLYSAITPLRAALSVKTTIWNTELYAEGLASVGNSFLVPDNNPLDTYSRRRVWNTAAFSGSIGVAQTFFADKLSMGGEFFYNGVNGLLWTSPADTALGLESEVTPFIQGANFALNLSYAPGWRGLRLGIKCLYAVKEQTAQLIPAVRFSPLPNFTLSIAAPIALGDRNGTYYRHNADKFNRPFSIALMLTFSGNYNWDNYE